MNVRSSAASVLLALAIPLVAASPTRGTGRWPQQPPADKPPAGTGRIAGRIVAAQTGRPLAGAVVTALSYEVLNPPRSVRTGRDGRFEFTALRAGRYRVDVRLDGYLPLEYGQRRPPELGRPIDLRDGEQFDRADFSLPRASAIEGTVYDEFGDPAPDIQMQIARLDYVAGRRRLMPVGSRIAVRPTDDRGRYRIYGLMPGEYYVIALTGAFRDPDATGAFAPTYHPGTPDPAAARPVNVAAGADATGVNMALVPARTVRLSGRVVDAAGEPVDRATVTLSISDRLGRADFLFARTATATDGRFTFRKVPDGSYTIQGFGRQVTTAGNLAASEFGWLPVTVAGEDQGNLELRVAEGPALRGRITFEGDTASRPKPGELRVTAAAVEFDAAPVGGGPPPSRMHDDYTFEVRNMSGRRAIRVDSRSPAWSVKRIVHRAQDVTDSPIEFQGRDIDDVEIVLTTRNPIVTGTVTTLEGQPARDYSVVVYSDDSARWRFPSRYVAVGRPNQEGQFTVRGLPPGDYLAVALAGLRGAEWQDPEFLEQLRPLAKPITLAEDETKTLELKLLPR
jgi:hypothetical protein